jgi:hypothetical protein
VRPLVVVGDALLDVDLVGTASGSPRTRPVPVVEDVERRERPGGAALAAVIAAAATSREVVLVTPLDTDEGAARLQAMLSGRVTLIPIPASGGTAVKQRVRVGDHSVARLDSGAPTATLGALPAAAAAAIRDAAAVLVADYGRGATAAAGRPGGPGCRDRAGGLGPARLSGRGLRCPTGAAGDANGAEAPRGPRPPAWPSRETGWAAVGARAEA